MGCQQEKGKSARKTEELKSKYGHKVNSMFKMEVLNQEISKDRNSLRGLSITVLKSSKKDQNRKGKSRNIADKVNKTRTEQKVPKEYNATFVSPILTKLLSYNVPKGLLSDKKKSLSKKIPQKKSSIP